MRYDKILELRKLREEEVRVVIEAWPKSKQLIGYQFLHASGCTLSGIDYEIDHALKKEFETA